MKNKKEINLSYTIHKDNFELDLRELPFINKIQFVKGLLLNQKINIYGKNKFGYKEINSDKDKNKVIEKKEEKIISISEIVILGLFGMITLLFKFKVWFMMGASIVTMIRILLRWIKRKKWMKRNKQ